MYNERMSIINFIERGNKLKEVELCPYCEDYCQEYCLYLYQDEEEGVFITHMFDNVQGKLIVFDHGVKEGVQRFRVNGLKSDLESLVHWLEMNSFKTYTPPIIEPTHPRSLHSTMLEIIIPDYD
jgi:hypothetical protein